MFSIRGRIEALKYSLKISPDENYLKGMFETLVDLHANYGLDILEPIPSDKVFLNNFERHEFSQFNEDGILDKIFQTIGMTTKMYHEARKENKVGTFLERKYGFREEADPSSQDLDLLSSDEDWYKLKRLLSESRPRVVVARYNGSFPPPEDRVVDDQGATDLSTDYQGASFEAFFKLGRRMGYNLVAADSTGYTLFMVRDDIPCPFYGVNDTSKLYRTPKMGHRPCADDGESHTEECLKTYRLDGIHGYKKGLGSATWTNADEQLAV